MPMRELDRRDLLRHLATGGAALGLGLRLHDDPPPPPHHTPRARRLLYVHLSGAPSQIDLFDPKPEVTRRHGQDLPDSVRQGQRITTMTSGQARLRLCGSRANFARRGQAGAWISDLLPHLAQQADRLAFVRSLWTEAINHEPAINLVHTGSEQPGRPSLGAWLSWALGSDARDLPSFVVLHSTWSGPKVDQPLYSRLWASGVLPSRHQGVLLRAHGDPVLFLQEPPGVSRTVRAEWLADLRALDQIGHARNGDPETLTRIAQHELAFAMQASVPELVDTSREPEHVLRRYGQEVHTPGTFARNALLARRLLERGVRCVQIWHRGWDQHRDLVPDLPRQCADVDQPLAAVLEDLAQRGLLDDTLVVWMSEFGRTVYAQGELDGTTWGRDHHPRCFTGWFAGGGSRAGAQVGATDELGYNVVAEPVHVHDFNATLLHLFGFDHERLSVPWQGRDLRLTDVHGKVVPGLLA